MKKFSKILSVALLVALVLSLGVANAFAVKRRARQRPTISTRSLILPCAALSATPDGKYDVFSYTIASKWTGFFDSAVWCLLERYKYNWFA